MYRSILASTRFAKTLFNTPISRDRSISIKASLNTTQLFDKKQTTWKEKNNFHFSTVTTTTSLRETTPIDTKSDLKPEHFAKYKLPAFYVNKRLQRLNSYIGNARKIRHSPWKMNRICQFAAQTKTIPEALIQLQFLNKRYAQNLHHAIRRTSNFADIKDGIQPSQLEVAECFATCAFRRKGITYHGKGKSGKRTTRFSHVRIVLREIDFDLKVLQSTTRNQKRRWLELKEVAENDAKIASEENKLLRKYEQSEKLKKEKEMEA